MEKSEKAITAGMESKGNSDRHQEGCIDGRGLKQNEHQACQPYELFAATDVTHPPNEIQIQKVS